MKKYNEKFHRIEKHYKLIPVQTLSSPKLIKWTFVMTSEVVKTDLVTARSSWTNFKKSKT